ncbi:MAG: S26 family signal peptidase [Bacteriovoracaceae bacterium]
MELKREDFERIRKNPIFKGVIVSGSMEPLIKVGEKIVVEVGNRELQRFDVITFWMDGKLVCHYVWSMNRVVTPFLLQTRNLKSGSKDVPINWDDYLGKVISHRLSAWDKVKIYFQLRSKRRR